MQTLFVTSQHDVEEIELDLEDLRFVAGGEGPKMDPNGGR